MFDDNIFNTNQRPIEITEEQAKAARVERFGYDPENPQEAPEGPIPQPKVLPGTGYEPGMFEGAWEAPFKGLGAAALGSASTALSLVGEVAPGDTFRAYAKDLRKLNRKWFEPDPEEMGTVGQIIRGLFEYVPKFAIYTAATGNPVTGAAAFGVDTGAGEYYRLRDEGVKTSTAMQAGAVTGVGNALGGIIPAAVGTSRAMSAIYGAATNVALDAGERAAVRTILENDNYQKIANRYETSWSDVALSAGMGGFFGAIAWRSPEQIQRQLREDQINRRADTISSIVTKKLKATGLFTDEAIALQVRQNARADAIFLENAGKSDDEIAEIVYKDFAKSEGDALNMGVTQERPWSMGSHVIGKEGDLVPVTKATRREYSNQELDRKLVITSDSGLVNEETGWRFVISGGDAGKIVHEMSRGNADRKEIGFAAVGALKELVLKARLVESHVDTKNKNNVVAGIHKFSAPMLYNGKLYSVGFVVRDYSRGGADGSPTVSLHTIGTFNIKKAISTGGEAGSAQQTPAASESTVPMESRSGGATLENDNHPADNVILSDLLAGFSRADGRGAFDPVDDSSKNNPKGVYYEPPEVIAQANLLARQNRDYGLMTRDVSPDDLNQRVVKIRAEKDYDPNWRPLRRTADNMTPEEAAVFNEYVDSRPDAARIRDNFERLEGTPWATQAREAVFVRASMLDLMAGREPRVQSMLDHPQMANLKRLLQEYGEEGLWQRLSENGFVWDAAKPAHNVNGSFLDCSPSLDCAKFCYATEGHYRYAASVVKSELIAEAVRRDPARAAEMTELEYKSTPEFIKGKTLRLYDKGDGNVSWIPYINELNKRGIRTQIFSKRADFLRQVSDFNLRLLSIDASNLKMADENPDLNVAFVYSDASQIPTILKIHHEGRLSVVLPVKEGVKYMSANKVDELRNADKTLAKHICPIDAGWQKIKSKKQPEGWNCTMCDKNAGVGCFHGASTENVMRAASQNEAKLIDVEGMDLVALAKLLQKELGNDLERVAKSGEGSGRAESQLGSVEGSRGGSGTINVSSSLAHKLQALLSGVIRGGERNLRQGAGEQTRGVRQGAEQVRAGMEEASGERSGGIVQRGVEGTQRADGQGVAGKSGSSAGGSDELAQIAYHGTPYVFDRFTLDHIGSGEGAQAHGWGLYFALDKKVADGYRERLTGDTKEGFVEKKLVRFGKKLKDALSSNRVSLGDIQTLYSKIASDSLPNVIEDMPGINGRSAEDIKARLGNPSREEARRLARVLDFVNDEIENRNTYDDFMENLESIKPEVRDYVKQTVLNGETWESTKGRLYSVDIPEDNVMLREDAKLEDQPDGVQMAVHNLLDGWYEKFTGEPFPGTRRGYEILAILEENLGGPKAAAMALKNEGVLGLRYEGGRDGECAVVWSEDAIGIRDALEQRLSSHIAGSYSAKLNRIILTALADLSTFSHEHAHWYMTKLLAYAGEEGMSSEIVQDALRLLNAMGIKSLDDWNAMSFEQQRVYHERFGAWVEIYLSKGRSPIRSLDDVFKRFGEWLVDMYRNKFGKTAEEHVGDRYKSEFDEDLPPLSDEVMAALDRMYGADAKARTVIPSVAQTVAARIAQAERANTDKVTSPMKDRNSDATYRAAKAAQIDARDQMNEGQKVDVSSSVREDDANADMVSSGTKTFARTAQMGGENDTIVVLQNRDRSTVASQAQMNSIAADPQYGKLSFSRTTDSGAPIVSYGSLPADEFVGNTDYVSDGGKRIPVTYAVVEADSIMTSNTWDGRQNEAYGSDPETIQAVAGNGRVAGLQEAYNRGTTDAYVQEMQADTTHGVSPDAIGKLQKPVLVRYVGRENVTTGFVDRSNQSAVLDMSGKERAVKDAGKLTSARMRGYTFDEDGNPTRDTLERFVNDIGEPSSLGALIDDNGLPTDRARDRIRAAVFYAAYRDEELTALVVDSSDKQGIKRILNAMSAFAPNVIAIREASNGAIDIGPVIVEAVNRLRSGRLIGEGDMFEETNPAVDQVFNILSQNRNSAAAIGRVFNDFMDRIEAALGGGTDALFGDAPDLAMAMQYLRAAENAQGQRLLELGKEFAPLPDIDVESVRATLAAIQEAAPNAEKVAVAMGEKVLEDAGVATKAEPAVETQTIDPRDPARAGAVFTESADVERLRNLFAEDPEASYVIEGPDGVAREMTAQDILDMEHQYAEQGQTDAVGIGKATECILRNGGIKE